MTKIISIIIFCLFIFQFSSCQSLKDLENSNVVFISYDSSLINVEKRVTNEGINYESNHNIYNYFFIAANGNIDKSYPIRFYYFGPQATSQSKYIYFKTHKSFIKKNRDIIITKDFMYKIGKEKTRELLNNAKAIFLIDKSEIKNNKVLVKQVVFHDILNI